MTRGERVVEAVRSAFDAIPGEPTLVTVNFFNRWTASEVTLTFVAKGIMHDWRLNPVRPLVGDWIVIVEGNSDIQPDEFVALVDRVRLRRMGPHGPMSLDGLEPVAIKVVRAVIGAIEAPLALAGRPRPARHGDSLEESLFGRRGSPLGPDHERVEGET